MYPPAGIAFVFWAAALGWTAPLTVRTDFEGGSIGRCDHAAQNHLQCEVRGEVDQDGRNRQASWYYFRVDGGPAREIIIDLTGLPGEYNYRPGNLAINAGTRPFVSYDEERWTALPDDAISWDAAIPRLRIRFRPSRFPLWIAHLPPYTNRHLNRLLGEVQKHPHLALSELGRSLGKRPIILLRITNPDRAQADKRVIWVTARQHAWETGTSWVAEGLVRFLLSSDSSAARLRDQFVFHVIPLADPDGVARGGVRFNANGYDLNRNWDVADPERMPEIHAQRQAVLDWVDAGRRLDLFLNLHNTNSDYIQGPLSAGGTELRRLMERLQRLLVERTSFAPAELRDWDPSPPERGRVDTCRFLFSARNIPALLLEINVQTNTRLGRPLHAEDYLAFGRQLAAALAEAVGFPGKNLVPNPAFQLSESGMPAAWSVWSPRDELRVEAPVGREAGGGLLVLKAPKPTSYGRWQTVVPKLRAGQAYRFEVFYRPLGVSWEQVSIPMVLTWCSDDAGSQMVQRDYVDQVLRLGEWRRATRTLIAPEGTRSLRIELGLRWAPGGAVAWMNPRLEEIEFAPRRVVRVVTTRLVPPRPATVESNRALMARVLDEAGARKPDLVLLSENFPDRSVKEPVEVTAEPIPGPTADLLAQKARQYSMYVAASLHEREGAVIYNTALLVDRRGRIAGKYRKTHLPLSEAENGISPGNSYPVFATDFGRVGMLVCWDFWFPEPARILRLHGAEILLLPIAGDGDPRHWDVISRARAMDNGFYVVTSNTVGNSPSRIIHPNGEVLAETRENPGIAVAELDLDFNHRIYWLSVGPGLGEPRSLYLWERRPDTYAPLSQDPR